jgi:hypothetical protein
MSKDDGFVTKNQITILRIIDNIDEHQKAPLESGAFS